MSWAVDDETPLLEDQSRDSQQNTERTPIPWNQFSIILLLDGLQPMSSQVIAPFLPQLIKDIGITDGKDSLIGYYVGLMHSLTYFTGACTIFHWNRMSDQVGRRPIVLTGLLGLSASMWCFGISKTFWALVLSRCLDSSLNGIIGIIKSMTIEMTDSTNVARAFGILPIGWAIGAMAGPLIGGSLARPTERFPSVFGNSAFFERYPYFLPCSVSATFTAIAWIITFLYLKESTKPRMTPWQYLFGGLTRDHQPRSDLEVVDPLHNEPVPKTTDRQLPLRAFLVRPVLIAAGSYASVSLIDMSLLTMLPVFYAMPIELGGLSLDPPAIGVILALLGVLNGIIQWLFFAPIYGWLGPRTFFLVSISLYLPTIALFPVMSIVVRVYRLGYFVWFLVGLQLTLSNFACSAYAVSFIFIGSAAPNAASIGATNGFALTLIFLVRAVGPATANSAYSFSIEKQILGGNLAYLVMVAMVGFAFWMGVLLPRNPLKQGPV